MKGINTDAIKAAMEELATESQKMGSALYQQQPTPEGGPTADAGDSQSQQADDEIADKKPASEAPLLLGAAMITVLLRRGSALSTTCMSPDRGGFDVERPT